MDRIEEITRILKPRFVSEVTTRQLAQQIAQLFEPQGDEDGLLTTDDVAKVIYEMLFRYLNRADYWPKKWPENPNASIEVLHCRRCAKDILSLTARQKDAECAQRIREHFRENALICQQRVEMAKVESYNEALYDYAWWKDGTQYVGCGNKTLKQALKEKYLE